MQRLLLAIMAICSILVTNTVVLKAQESGPAVDPSHGPVSIDEPAAPLHAGVETGTHPAGNQNLIDNQVELAPHNEPPAANIHHNVYHSVHKVYLPEGHRRQSWFGAQFALMLFGLLGAIFASALAPNASRRVSDHVSTNTRRDLRIGAVVGGLLLLVLIADAILLKLPLIKLLWAPIGIMVAFAPLLLLGFGWLAGMRCAGDRVAGKLGWTGEGTQVGRTALGLIAFFALNVVVGTLCRPLGVVALCLEICIALMGVGATATIATGRGFGRGA